MNAEHAVHKPAPKEQVPFKTKIAWGFGGLADNYIMNAFNLLVLVLFVEGFKMPPLLAGVATFIPRFCDAITDPLIGNISDNTRTRWGRRRPYIAWGVVLSALLLPVLWYPPAVETATSVWYANRPFIFLALVGSLYTTAYTIFMIPYTALGYELTNDYDERTRVMAWRMYIGFFGSMTVPWLYRLTQIDWLEKIGEGPLRDLLTSGLPGYDSDLQLIGARVVCVLLGVLIIGAGIIPAIFCREKTDAMKQEKVSLTGAIRYTFTNIPFIMLSVAYVIILVGHFAAYNMFMFLLIHYVFGGDRAAAGNLSGMIGMVSGVVSYASIFLIKGVSVRFSKKTAMITGLSISLLGMVATWFSMDPRWPNMMLGARALTILGLTGCWLMIASMVADVCDEDEWKTGLRREGMFGAANGFTLKLSMAITTLLTGWMLSLAGFDPTAVGDGCAAPEVAYRMKALALGSQAVGTAVGLIMMFFYPLTRKHSEETRRKLDARNAAAKPEAS